MLDHDHSMPNHDQLLLLDEVAQIARASLPTVRHWIREGRLASVRPGRRRMVWRSELMRFLGT